MHTAKALVSAVNSDLIPEISAAMTVPHRLQVGTWVSDLIPVKGAPAWPQLCAMLILNMDEEVTKVRVHQIMSAEGLLDNSFVEASKEHFFAGPNFGAHKNEQM